MPVLVNFVQLLATVLWLLLIARVVLSWTNPTGRRRAVAFIYQVTEPILAPIRRVLPPTGGIDWSPLIAMLLVGIVVRVIVRVALRPPAPIDGPAGARRLYCDLPDGRLAQLVRAHGSHP